MMSELLHLWFIPVCSGVSARGELVGALISALGERVFSREPIWCDGVGVGFLWEPVDRPDWSRYSFMGDIWPWVAGVVAGAWGTRVDWAGLTAWRGVREADRSDLED